MKNLKQIQDMLSECKIEMFENYHVKNMAIFGSYARDEQNIHSDMDILVEFIKPVGVEFIDLANDLERLLNIPDDLVSRHGIKPKYFHEI